MRRHLFVLTVGIASALGVWGVSAVQGGRPAEDDAEAKAAREATLSLADMIAKNDDVKAKAKEIAKKVDDIEKVMQVMKLRSQGGVGLGPKAGAITPDGMEALIINWSTGKKLPPQNQVTARAEAIGRMADIINAVAEISIAKGPPKVGGKKKKEDWDRWIGDMKDGAVDLKKAAAKQDPMAVKSAIVKLNASCTDCHAIWKEK